MNHVIPKITNKFICIVDRNQPQLAAVISSYISTPGCYVPFFVLPTISALKQEETDGLIDEFSMGRKMGHEFDVLIHNFIRRLKGCDNLLLAGLSEEQKSHFTFLKDYNIIEIDTIADADFLLTPFAMERTKYFTCSPNQVIEGLSYALNHNLKLKIGEATTFEPTIETKKKGIIVIEDISSADIIIATNYAFSVNADLKIVTPLAKYNNKYIRSLISDWRKGNNMAFDELSYLVTQRIGDIDFAGYKYATFFTDGLPYSLIIKNVIPCSYINLMLRPDMFILNNLIFEKETKSHSAIIFSPQAFKDEETRFVIDLFKTSNFYVRELIGKVASVFNLDMHIKEFPYNILHICSHGGEVGGYAIQLDFTDRNGNPHTIEYDEVVTIAPNGEEKIPVFTKNIWRKFNGLTWRSPELKAKNYPQYVFADMQNAIKEAFDKNLLIRSIKEKVDGSCAIVCSDFNYQATFDTVAAITTAPIFFNNSCWSWSGITDHFLAGGARSYIGTFWDIENDVATEGAKVFYQHILDCTVSESLHIAMNVTKGTDSENIYMLWGTHFSTLKRASNYAESRQEVFESLLHTFYRWLELRDKTTRESVRANISRNMSWISEQLRLHFFLDYLKAMNKRKK